MVRAITGIDDDLISDAHMAGERRVIPWRKLEALAAGFVLMISAAFLLMPGGEITIQVCGQKLTAEAVTVEQAAFGAQIRAYSMDPVTVFTVPMEIKVRGYTVVTVSGGSIQVFDCRGNSLLHKGGMFGTKEDVNILWSVENDGTDARFEMSVEGGKTAETVILTCEGGEWKIRSERN